MSVDDSKLWSNQFEKLRNWPMLISDNMREKAYFMSIL